LKRGDLVVVALPGDYGKPRPALIVQADLFNETHASITIVPVTSTLVTRRSSALLWSRRKRTAYVRCPSSWLTKSRPYRALASPRLSAAWKMT
jgi:mRNA-degrading endonuclease toxin of MazEF toxin-antitoxin module